MSRRLIPFLVCTIILGLNGCSESSSPTDPGPIILPSFQTVFKATNTGVHERRGEVILSQERWEEVWSEIHAGQQTPGVPAPTIDFGTNMLVMASMGDEPDGCWDIGITEVRAVVVRLEVAVAETRPPLSCTCPAVVVQPVHVVQVERADLPAQFRFVRSILGVGCN